MARSLISWGIALGAGIFMLYLIKATGISGNSGLCQDCRYHTNGPHTPDVHLPSAGYEVGGYVFPDY